MLIFGKFFKFAEKYFWTFKNFLILSDLNGIPPLVQFVECIDNNVAHSAVVALRNLAEDIQNKKTIGKYGMQAIVAKVKSTLFHEHCKS